MIWSSSIPVVDGEAGSREFLRMILKPVYDIHTVENGREAINFISQERVDLVSLDLNMPDRSGIEIVKEIRKLEPDIEVMIINGDGTLNNVQEAFRCGAGVFVSKPFKVADIICQVSKAFERRRHNKQIKDLIRQIRSLRPSLTGEK